MLINYLGAITVIVGALSIGISKAHDERKKTITLRQLCEFLELMKNEIYAEKTTLIKLFSLESLSEFDAISNFIKSLRENISSLGEKRFCDIWCSCVNESLSALPDKAKSALLALGNSLGKYDSQMQKSAIERCENEIIKEYELKDIQLKNNEKMYIGLGGCAGLILALMLI